MDTSFHSHAKKQTRCARAPLGRSGWAPARTPIHSAAPRLGAQGGAAHPGTGSRAPQPGAAPVARASQWRDTPEPGEGGRTAALLTWTSSSEGNRGPAAGGGAGCAGGWWCACFRSSPGKSAASRAGFAAPSTGLSCANTGSSCVAGGWGTGPRRALMVSTRVAMGGQGGATGAGGTGRLRFPPRPGWLGTADSARGPLRGTLGPAASGSRRRARRSGLLGSATRHRRGPPAATFSRPAPELSRSARNPLPPPPSSTSKLRARVPAPRLLTLDARLYFTQLRGRQDQLTRLAASWPIVRPQSQQLANGNQVPQGPASDGPTAPLAGQELRAQGCGAVCTQLLWQIGPEEHRAEGKRGAGGI